MLHKLCNTKNDTVSSVLLQILSGASNGFNTGMPKQDIVLATAVATAVATATMGEMRLSTLGCNQ
jgi:hypothetical protein